MNSSATGAGTGGRVMSGPGKSRSRQQPGRRLPVLVMFVMLAALVGCATLTGAELRLRQGVYRVGVISKSDTEVFAAFDLKLGEECAVPGTSMTLVAERFLPSFSFSDSRREISSSSDDLHNPALLLHVYEDGRLVYRDWIFIRAAQYGNMSRLPTAFLLLKINLPEQGGRPAEEMRAEQWWGENWRQTLRFAY